MAAVAKVLLDAGAGLDSKIERRPGRRDGRSPLECACATASTSAGNEPLIRLLLERGAVPGDHDLYMVAFAKNRDRCLPLLLAHTPDIAETARMALAAPISIGDAESVRMMLEAGVDPSRYHDDEDQPSSAAYAAVSCGSSAELLELLLAHHADPTAPGRDGRSPMQLATAHGRTDLAELLLRHGAVDDATDADRLRSACLRADHGRVEEQLAANPALRHDPARVLGETILHASETGNAAAVRLILDVGYPLEAHVGEDGGTVLHAAAYAGNAETVRLLLDRGADIEARDARWHSTPLVWATIGSGQRPRHNPAADWAATVDALIEAGACTEDIALSPDDPKPPSRQVAELLRRHGIVAESDPATENAG